MNKFAIQLKRIAQKLKKGKLFSVSSPEEVKQFYHLLPLLESGLPDLLVSLANILSQYKLDTFSKSLSEEDLRSLKFVQEKLNLRSLQGTENTLQALKHFCANNAKLIKAAFHGYAHAAEEIIFEWILEAARGGKDIRSGWDAKKEKTKGENEAAAEFINSNKNFVKPGCVKNLQFLKFPWDQIRPNSYRAKELKQAILKVVQAVQTTKFEEPSVA